MSASSAITFFQVVRIVITLFVFDEISRVMGIAMLGQFMALQVYVSFLPRFVDLGIPNALIYFAKKGDLYISRNAGVFRAACAFFLLYCVSAQALFPSSNLVYIVGVCVFNELILIFLLSYLLSTDRFFLYGLLQLVPQILFVGLFLALGKDFTSAADIMITFSVAQMLGIFAFLASYPFLGFNEESDRFPTSRNFIKYSRTSYLSSVTKVFNQRIDRLGLAFLMNDVNFAMFALACSVRDALLMPANNILLVFRNRLTERQKLFCEPRPSKTISKVLLPLLVVYFFLVTLTLLIGFDTILLIFPSLIFSSDYNALALAILFAILIYNFALTVFQSTGTLEPILYTNYFSLALSLVILLCLWFFDPGSWRAALSMSLVPFSAAIISCIFFLKRRI